MICLKPLLGLPGLPMIVTCKIKVVYNHTGIASYWHLRVGNVGGEYSYWLLEGNECCMLGVFQLTLFCPGPRRTVETEARV
jgi:hypothetical protein